MYSGGKLNIARDTDLELGAFDGTTKQSHGETINQPIDGTPGLPNAATNIKGGHDANNSPFPSKLAVWPHYIYNTAEEAKVDAQIWQTTVNTHLVFAGLFAGVLASFVLSSREDLLDDSAKVILEDIRNGVRTQPAEPFKVPPLALVVNTLWLVSFSFTLFGAIMGGIVTAWFMKAAATSTETTSLEAYKRWILKKHIWRLKRLAVAIPTALHASLLLFGIGFGIQALQDHSILGAIMISLMSAGTVFYIAVTLAPIFTPRLHAGFFRTPPFELAVGTVELIKDLWSSEGKDMPPKTSDENRVLATIFLEMINSTQDPIGVDLAIRDLVKHIKDEEWIQYFLVTHQVWKVCFTRLEECAWSPATSVDTTSQINTIILHLEALLHFWEWFHIYHRKHNHAVHILVDPNLFPEELYLSIEPGKILHRWNSLPEASRRIAFCLRAIVYTHAEKPLPRQEMAELPWEIIRQHAMHRTHRWAFAKTICRLFLGLGSASRLATKFAVSVTPTASSPFNPPLPSKSVQSICAICICLSVVSAVRHESSTEWVANAQNQTDSIKRGRGCLSALLTKLLQQWKDIASPQAQAPQAQAPVTTTTDVTRDLVANDSHEATGSAPNSAADSMEIGSAVLLASNGASDIDAGQRIHDIIEIAKKAIENGGRADEPLFGGLHELCHGKTLKLDDKLEAVVIMKIKSIFQTGASLDRALFPILSCLVALSRGGSKHAYETLVKIGVDSQYGQTVHSQAVASVRTVLDHSRTSQSVVYLLPNTDAPHLRALNPTENHSWVDLSTKGKVYSIILSALDSPSSSSHIEAFHVLRAVTAEPSVGFSDDLTSMVVFILDAAAQPASTKVKQVAKDIFSNISEWQQPEINTRVLELLPNMLDPGNKGRSLTLDFMRRLDLSKHDYNLVPMGYAVFKLIKKGDWHSDQEIVQLLGQIHSKCEGSINSSCKEFMAVLVEQVVGMAVQDQRHAVRSVCFDLLIELQKCTKCREFEILRAQIIPSLDVKHSRSQAAELISLLCRDALVRRKVSTWIINRATELGSSQIEQEAMAVLLLRLIDDMRLDLDTKPSADSQGKDDLEIVLATDYALLLLASILVMRPAFSKYKVKLAKAMCKYEQTIDKSPRIPDQFVDWFLFVVFGHHATDEEVGQWLEMNGSLH